MASTIGLHGWNRNTDRAAQLRGLSEITQVDGWNRTSEVYTLHIFSSAHLALAQTSLKWRNFAIGTRLLRTHTPSRFPGNPFPAFAAQC